MQAPCKDCPKQGCGTYHDECPEYQEFRKERDRLSDERVKRNMVEVTLNTFEIERAQKRARMLSRLKQR